MSNTRHLNYQSIHKEEKRMKFELTEQSVQFTFGNKRYKNGLATKSYANVKKETPADKLKLVGQTIANLQEDSLDDVILVQKQRVIDVAE